MMCAGGMTMMMEAMTDSLKNIHHKNSSRYTMYLFGTKKSDVSFPTSVN